MLQIAVIIIFSLIFLLLIFLKLISTPRIPFCFRGSHVMITGASSGIGSALAKRAFLMGANVTLVARRKEKLKSTKEWILMTSSAADEFPGDRIHYLPLDITTSFPLVQKAIQLAEEKFGAVDLLVNCAGFSHPCAFEEMAVGDFERMMRVNYMGSVQVTKATLPGMIKKYSTKSEGRNKEEWEMNEGLGGQDNRNKGMNERLYGTEGEDGGGNKKESSDGVVVKEGRVLFVSSQAGQVGLYGYSGYSASKFALRGLAEALHMEMVPHNIKVCVAYPPDTDTPGYEEENKSKPLETMLISESSGLFRPDEVADSIVTGVERGDFSIHIGLEGGYLSNLTAGMGPSDTPLKSLLQVLFGGVFRLVGLVYRKKFQDIVMRCHVEGKKKNI